MDLKEEIGFDDLLHAVQQLPEDKRAILKEELSKPTTQTGITKKKLSDDKLTDFQKFLLNGPVMTDEHYEVFKETQKQLNSWTRK
jgi:hypothetical protein